MLGFLPNIQGFEWLIILLIALLIFGHRLPAAMRSLGGSIAQFKKGVNDPDETGTGEAPSTPSNPTTPQK